MLVPWAGADPMDTYRKNDFVVFFVENLGHSQVDGTGAADDALVSGDGSNEHRTGETPDREHGEQQGLKILASSEIIERKNNGCVDRFIGAAISVS